jgi:hypothetical protein
MQAFHLFVLVPEWERHQKLGHFDSIVDEEFWTGSLPEFTNPGRHPVPGPEESFEEYLCDSFTTLAGYLKEATGRGCIVLIDNYDSPMCDLSMSDGDFVCTSIGQLGSCSSTPLRQIPLTYNYVSPAIVLDRSVADPLRVLGFLKIWLTTCLEVITVTSHAA